MQDIENTNWEEELQIKFGNGENADNESISGYLGDLKSFILAKIEEAREEATEEVMQAAFIIKEQEIKEAREEAVEELRKKIEKHNLLIEVRKNKK